MLFIDQDNVATYVDNKSDLLNMLFDNQAHDQIQYINTDATALLPCLDNEHHRTWAKFNDSCRKVSRVL